MKCRQCGTEIADKAIICYRCGTATTEPKFKPPNAAAQRRSSRSRTIVIVLLALLLLLLGFLVLSGNLVIAQSGNQIGRIHRAIEWVSASIQIPDDLIDLRPNDRLACSHDLDVLPAPLRLVAL
jgi:hypothetical protein